MKKLYRLQGHREFRALLSRGRRRDAPLFRIIFKQSDLVHSRYAFVASRAVDKRSAARHRLIRRAREWARKQPSRAASKFDIAIFFKKDAARAPRKIFYEELDKTFSEITR